MRKTKSNSITVIPYPNPTPMPREQTFTITTRLSKQDSKELIEYFNQYRTEFGKMERFIWQDIVHRKGISGKNAKNKYSQEIQKRFGVLKRTADAMINNMTGRYKALKELKKIELENLNNKIETLEKRLNKLVKGIKELAAKAAKNELDEKQLKSYRSKKQSRFYKRMKLNRLKQQRDQLKKDIENGVYKLCFGTKKLFKAQYHLADNGFRSHQGWYNEFVKRRDCNIFYIGDKTTTACNQLFQLTPLGNGRFEIQVRKAEKNEDKPKNDPNNYVKGFCSFKYMVEELEEAVTKEDRAVSYRIVFRGRKIYLQAMLELNLDKRPLKTDEDNGAIGLDFNSGHIDLSETDRHGNLVYMAQYPLKFHGTGKKAEDEMRTIVSEIGKYALSVGKAIVKEGLSFKGKKSKTSPAKSKKGKKYNRMIHTLDYSRFHASLLNMSIRKGIKLIVINPAYTSKIAKQKYCPDRKLKVHNGAAYVIAREGQGFITNYKRYVKSKKAKRAKRTKKVA